MTTIEERVTTLEERVDHLLVTPPTALSVEAMKALVARGVEVQAEAMRTLLPWCEVNPGLRARSAVQGSARITVGHSSQNGYRLDVEDGLRNEAPGHDPQGTWRVPLTQAHDMDEAVRLAEVILTIAGWRLENG